jgi:uncharacterized repeat protein (TIGR01451 family)
MKTRLSGVRPIVAAAATIAIAVVTLPMASAPAAADAAAAVGSASMSIDMSSSTASYAAVGDVVSFTDTVTNTGTVPLTDVVVSDALASPAGTTSAPTCQSVSGGGSCTGGDAASLPSGAVAVFAASYAVNQSDLDNGTVSGSASVTGTAAGGTVSATSNPTSVAAVARPVVTLVASATVPASPDGRYSAGQSVDYAYAIGNSGNVTLSPVSLTDSLPGLSAPSCPDNTLAPGATETCTATKTATAADVGAGSLTDAAVVTATPPHGMGVTATSSTTVTADGAPSDPTPTATVGAGPSTASVMRVPASEGPIRGPTQGQSGTQHPSISLTKTATVENSSNGRYAMAGQTVDYSYLVTNTGNVKLDPVVLKDPMTGLQGLRCPGTGLAAGQSETCTATYTVTLADMDAGSITNTATVSGTPTCGGPNVRATSSATVYARQQPSISLTKTATVEGSTDGRYSAAGQTVDYSYLIANTGNVVLDPVTLQDPMPGLVGLQCPDTALFPGISELCTASYTTTQADVAAGSITNKATAVGTPTCGPKVWSTSSATVYGEKAPGIALTKTATVVGSADGRFSAAGQTIDYSYLVTNTGNVKLDPVTLQDAKPDLQGLACPDTALVPGASETCTATYITTQADVDAGVIKNTATATGHPPCGHPVTATSTAVVYGQQSPSIAVVKTANVPAVSALGQSVLYTFTVTNTGNVTLHDVDVTDAQAAPSLDASLGPITCANGTNGSFTLAPGARATCSATYTVTQADLTNGSVTDTATATGHPPSGPPVTATSTLTLPVTLITVTKAVNLTTIVAGSAAPIVYTITVTNAGTAATTDPIIVTDAAPAGTTLVASSPVCATGGPSTCSVSTSGGTITWTIAAGVAPTSVYTLTYAVTLDSSEVGGDTIVNTAMWTGPSCNPPTATCSSNTVVTTVTAAPVTKLASTPPAATPPAPVSAPVSSAPPAIAFTGAYLSRELIIGLAAAALGSALVTLARRRRRSPGGAVKPH